MTDVEEIAREFVRKIVAAPGRADQVDTICSAARDMLMATASSIAGSSENAAAIADRIEMILRDIAPDSGVAVAAITAQNSAVSAVSMRPRR